MIESFIEQIPKNSRIAIFGAGITGVGIKNYIHENRKDVQILYFIDSKEKGIREDIPIINFIDIEKYKKDFDLIVIATRKTINELICIFDYLELPYIYVSHYIEEYFHLKNFFPKQQKAANIFSGREDFELYNLVWEHRINYHEPKIAEYAKRHNLTPQTHSRNYNKHYLEYINKEAIKTIIDGGFCNGVHALSFKKNLPNLEKIYAFEPMYEKFKDIIIDKLIQEAKFCEIVEYGLWDKEDKLIFAENLLAPSWSRILKKDQKPKKQEQLTEIKTISIDIFSERFMKNKIDFIKMDIEGSELLALEGGINTIIKNRPQLAISIYHSNDDFVEIPLYLNNKLKDYIFKLGHYSNGMLETVLYAIPKELYKES